MSNQSISIVRSLRVGFTFTPNKVIPANMGPDPAVIAAGNCYPLVGSTYPNPRPSWPAVFTSNNGAFDYEGGIRILSFRSGVATEYPFKLSACKITLAASLYFMRGGSIYEDFTNILIKTGTGPRFLTSIGGYDIDGKTFAVPMGSFNAQTTDNMQLIGTSMGSTAKYPYLQVTTIDPVYLSAQNILSFEHSVAAINPTAGTNNMINALGTMWDGLAGADFMMANGLAQIEAQLDIDPTYFDNVQSAETDLYIIIPLSYGNGVGFADPVSGNCSGANRGTSSSVPPSNYNGSRGYFIIPLQYLKNSNNNTYSNSFQSAPSIAGDAFKNTILTSRDALGSGYYENDALWGLSATIGRPRSVGLTGPAAIGSFNGTAGVGPL